MPAPHLVLCRTHRRNAQEFPLFHAIEGVLVPLLGYAVQDQPPAHQAAVIEVRLPPPFRLPAAPPPQLTARTRLPTHCRC